jgi:hypothetical protein
MSLKIKHALLIGMSVLWLAACGGSGMDEPTQHTTNAGPSTGPSTGIPNCPDRSSAVGIEGGGMRRIAGVIGDITADGNMLIGCQRISASNATVLIAGQPGKISDLQVGEIVEVVGTINPESGVLQAQSIATKDVSAQHPHGRYIGTVTIGNQQLFGDAIITVDGAVRLYVGGPYDNGGELQLTRPAAGSAQFVGHLETATNASGSAMGLVIGQGCTDPQVVRFCSGAATGEMSFTVRPVSGAAIDANLDGVLHVATSAGEETWVLDLGNWDNVYVLTPLVGDPGPFLNQEELAEFATADDTVITFSGSQLQFQSAHSGCTGNGSIVTHGDGSFFVFDVVLDIGNCNATYARFNGRFEGLASSSASSVWDYDDWFRMWLSKPNGTEPPVALTMLSAPVY